MQYVVYSLDGRILRYGEVDHIDVALLQATNEGETVLITDVQVNDLTQYVQDGRVIDRPQISDFQNIPMGTVVKVNKEPRGIVEDGILEIEATMPGQYIIRLEPPFPYCPLEVLHEIKS